MNETKKRRTLTVTLCAVSAAAILAGVYLLLRYTNSYLPCIFNRLTGLRCPGCGNTRAVMAYLRFDFRDAIRHNYLFPLEAAYLLWVAAVSSRQYIKSGKFAYVHSAPALDYSVLALTLVWTVLRNFIGI